MTADEMTMEQLMEHLRAADAHFDDAETLIARSPRDLVRGTVHRARHSIHTDAWAGEIVDG